MASQTTALHSTAAQVSTAHLQQLTVTVASQTTALHSTAAQVSTVQYISTTPHNHSVASQTTALHSTAAQVSKVTTPYSNIQSPDTIS